jgi:hypothetical protein
MRPRHLHAPGKPCTVAIDDTVRRGDVGLAWQGNRMMRAARDIVTAVGSYASAPVNLGEKSFRIEWSFAFDRHDPVSLPPVSEEPTFSHHKSFFAVSNIEQIAARWVF